MKNAISDILNKIPKGEIFDSHYIIAQLIKLHSDDYLNFASGISGSSDKTLSVHGQIGKEIARFETQQLISRLDNMSWSENIHGNSSECTALGKAIEFANNCISTDGNSPPSGFFPKFQIKDHC